MFVMTKWDLALPIGALILVLYSFFVIHQEKRQDIIGFDGEDMVFHTMVTGGYLLIIIVTYVIYSLRRWDLTNVIDSLHYPIITKDQLIHLQLEDRQEILSPERVSFSNATVDLHLKPLLLQRMWQRRNLLDLRTWIQNNITVETKDLLRVMEDEFCKNLHVMVASQEEFISPAVELEIQNTNYVEWLDLSLLQLFYGPPEMNSQIHKIVVNDSQRDEFLRMLRNTREKLIEQYSITMNVHLILLYQRACMIEIVYRKTNSWRMSNENIFYAKKGNQLLNVIFRLQYHHNPITVLAKQGTHPRYITQWEVVEHNVMIKDFDQLQMLPQMQNLMVTVAKQLNLYQGENKSYYSYRLTHLQDRICGRMHTYLMKQQGQVMLYDPVEQSTTTTVALDLRVINANHYDQHQHLDRSIQLQGMCLQLFDVSMYVNQGARYRWVDDEIGYRWMELCDTNRTIMLYAGDGDFKLGVRRIKRLKMHGDKEIQQKITPLVPEGVVVDWVAKEKHNDHTYAHNLSMVKRTEVINKVAGHDIVLEIGSNLNSQLYTAGLIVNLANISQSDVERRINLMDQVLKLLHWESAENEHPNHYVCLNFQELKDINMQSLGVSRVVMHNVIHNIPMEQTVKFMVRHPMIEVIETSTYLPINVLNRKVINDQESGMVWNYNETEVMNDGLFHESEGVVTAYMPAGDPVYIHDPAIMHDYLRTTVIHLLQNEEQDLRSSSMLVFTIKDMLDNYIRMRITRGYGVKTIESAVLTKHADLPEQIIHVKQSLTQTTVAIYPLSISEMFKAASLLEMNNTQQRVDMMKAVRTETDTQRAMARMRIVDAAQRGVPITVVDPLNFKSTLRKEQLLVVSMFASLPRRSRKIVIPHTEGAVYSENHNMNDRVCVGSYNNWSTLCDRHNVTNVNVDEIDRVRIIISRWMLQYNVVIDNNNQKFMINGEHDRTLLIHRTTDQIKVNFIKTNGVYSENYVHLTNMNDILNALLFTLYSHGDNDCVTRIVQRYDIVRMKYKAFYSYNEMINMMNNRTVEEEYHERELEREIDVGYDKVNNRQNRNNTQSTVRNANHRVLPKYRMVPLDPAPAGVNQARYIIINKHYLTTNSRVAHMQGRPGAQVQVQQNGHHMFIENPNTSTLDRIQVVVIKGHVYEIIGGIGYFLFDHFSTVNVPADVLSERIGHRDFGKVVVDTVIRAELLFKGREDDILKMQNLDFTPNDENENERNTMVHPVVSREEESGMSAVEINEQKHTRNQHKRHRRKTKRTKRRW